jgi:uncharacterized membrane protein
VSTPMLKICTERPAEDRRVGRFRRPTTCVAPADYGTLQCIARGRAVHESHRPQSTTMRPISLAFLLGIVAGLRSMTPPAAVAWAARLGWLHLEGTPLAFLGSTAAAYVLTGFMLAELVADKLPRTPSRTRPGPFLARLVTGGLAGAALTAGVGSSLALGALLGALGAVAGTLGGYKARTGLVRALRVPDLVVALAEDAVAVGGAYLILAATR